LKNNMMSTEQTALSGSVMIMIQNVYKQLRQSERAVADYIIQNPENVINSNISEVAKECSISEATVIRFCKTAGFAGFHDLKLSLARGASNTMDTPLIYENIKKEDSLDSAIEKMHANNMQALTGTFKCLNLDQLSEVSRAISKTRLIHIFGLGTSGLVAQYAEYRFVRIGLLARACTDSHQIALATALVQKDDVVLIVSQSGTTKDIVEQMDVLKKKEAITICITGYPNSPAAKLSKHILRNMVHEAPFASGGIPSLMAQLSVVDALLAGASLNDFDHSIRMIEETGEALKSKKY
jgi:RpiR family carbohydrate utilization transcriptional regulator